MNEVLRTSGDIRRFLAQAMAEVRSGELELNKAQTIATLSKEITASLNAEVAVAKVRAGMMSIGKDIGEVTRMGKLVIEDDGSVPTLKGY